MPEDIRTLRRKVIDETPWIPWYFVYPDTDNVTFVTQSMEGLAPLSDLWLAAKESTVAIENMMRD